MSFRFKFGTAGIRARVGKREDELNLESVRTIGAAIMAQLRTLPDRLNGEVCVAFDGRSDSRSFAHELCAVTLAQGFRVALFEEPTPTPLLAFSVRERKALAGLMVTASHNPPEDNGIKLYLSGGKQIAAPLDAEIEARIASELEPDAIPRADLRAARERGELAALGEEEVRAYVQRLQALVPHAADLPLPRIAYSALCGVGTPLTRAVLATLGVENLIEVAEQALPRADFGGLRSPNPEEASALERLERCAHDAHVDAAFAHDPDADRLAVLARSKTGELQRLSGDDVGALIGDFLLSRHPSPARSLVVSTLVSGGLLEQICAARGAHYLRTKTGFKWIAQAGRNLAQRESLDLLFGYEEAIGYAFFGMADDKDGVAALYVLCVLLKQLAAQGKTLLDRLEELERAHGVFLTRQLTVSAQGPDGSARMRDVMERLRSVPPERVLGPGGTRADYERAPEPFPLLVLRADDGTRVCVRPSGTEPKLKLYLHVRQDAVAGVSTARALATARLDALATTLSAYTTV